MQVVLVEPQKKAVVQNIDGTLEAMQRIVGGTIQALHPFYDIVSGTFFLCAAPPDSDRFESLSDRQVKTYMERFAVPEMFLNLGGALFVLPYL